MSNYQITIGPFTVALSTIAAFIVGMIVMRIYCWNAKRVRTATASVTGSIYRFDGDDTNRVEEQVRKENPKCQHILKIECIRTLASPHSETSDRRIYEVTYI